MCNRSILLLLLFVLTTVTSPDSQGATFVVTSLKDNGPGTLREALSAGNRRVEFRIAGEIRLKKILEVTADNLEIDGRSSPGFGLTITGKPFSLNGARNVQIRNLRFRNSSDDNIRITGACDNILFENCSTTHGGDGALDITNDYKTLRRPNRITVRNCIIGATDKAMLIVGTDNVSLEGNLFTNTGQRNPQLRESKNFNIVNNVILNFTVYGILVRAGSTGNIIGNVIPLSPLLPKRPDRAVRIDQSTEKCQVFTASNIGPKGYDLNEQGSTSRPVGSTPTSRSAGSLERTLSSRVGALPLDRIDQSLVKNDPSIKFRESMTKDK
jgi:pectate lyase